MKLENAETSMKVRAMLARKNPLLLDSKGPNGDLHAYLIYYYDPRGK